MQKPKYTSAITKATQHCVFDVISMEQTRMRDYWNNGFAVHSVRPISKQTVPHRQAVAKAVPNRRRRGIHKGIPANAVVIPNVPIDDYYSQMPGVYYHFAKLEWRATCRDPFVCSKRTQRTFGVRKYGFYEAKLRAEVAAHEWDKHREVINFLKTVSTGEAPKQPIRRPTPPPPPQNDLSNPYGYPFIVYGYTEYQQNDSHPITRLQASAPYFYNSSQLNHI
ncbi:uncharacterized protein BXIN_1136 [Babesia sp. Xinjiang]|uniref:uncharacterized protein n=1 Tax=Babesia sp. Xinjiang TaxID=462227 RepID=UPI000A2336B2|nr:uncharacterized protein BXIN_1136 [Babesia sp. Xinjiang]ORM42348.1 hypothetical protein BXIN_1136 [Babesia sp. Xinjiang]